MTVNFTAGVVVCGNSPDGCIAVSGTLLVKCDSANLPGGRAEILACLVISEFPYKVR